LATDWVEKVNSTAQEHVSEPVIAAVMEGHEDGIARPHRRQALRVLLQQKGRRGWKIQEQLGVWDRSDIRVGTEPGKLSTKVVFDVVSSGEHYELEATTVSTANFNEPFLAAIA
jgi:hypothetical protein